MTASYLTGKVLIVIGDGSETHRGVAVALAEAGADVAIAGLVADLSAEAALHSIANEIWAMGRKSVVVTLANPEDTGADRVTAELGPPDVVVRCSPASP